MQQALVKICIPEGVRFSDLKLSRDADVTILREGPEDIVSGLIVQWYQNHLAAGGEHDPVQDDLLAEVRTASQPRFGARLMSAPTPEEIKSARERAGLTQTQAAYLVHGTMRAWQEWEAGNRKMHPGLWELFNIKTAPSYRKSQRRR